MSARFAWEQPQGHLIEVFAEQSSVTPQDVIDLWLREGAVDEAEARRRIGEVLLVATAPDGELVGVSSAYLQFNVQLRMYLWYYRVFIASSGGARLASVGHAMAGIGREELKRRWIEGDLRGAGLLLEIEHEGLRRHRNEARWDPLDFVYIGDTAHGAHVRVHFFPGAEAPQPGAQGSA